MSMSMKTYILEGKTIRLAESQAEFHRFFSDIDRRRVAHSDVYANVYVSTVFLGFDHGFDDNSPPVLFETLVFGGALSEEMIRYTTYDEALAGHHEMVARVRKEGGVSFDPWEARVSRMFWDDDTVN